MRNFDINEMMGFWYVVQYYASSEEAAEYSCMKCNFSMSDESALVGFFLLFFAFFLIKRPFTPHTIHFAIFHSH